MKKKVLSIVAIVTIVLVSMTSCSDKSVTVGGETFVNQQAFNEAVHNAIESNTEAINQNSQNIATNTNAIQGNADLISSMQADLDALKTSTTINTKNSGWYHNRLKALEDSTIHYLKGTEVKLKGKDFEMNGTLTVGH